MQKSYFFSATFNMSESDESINEKSQMYSQSHIKSRKLFILLHPGNNYLGEFIAL